MLEKDKNATRQTLRLVAILLVPVVGFFSLTLVDLGVSLRDYHKAHAAEVAFNNTHAIARVVSSLQVGLTNVQSKQAVIGDVTSHLIGTLIIKSFIYFGLFKDPYLSTQFYVDICSQLMNVCNFEKVCLQRCLKRRGDIGLSDRLRATVREDTVSKCFAACSGHSFEACSGHSFEACSGHSFEACSGHSFAACSGHSFAACSGHSFAACSGNSFEACSGHSFEACSGHSFAACSGHSFAACSGHSFAACSGHSFEACSGHSFEACSGHSFAACSGHSFAACSGHSFEACSGHSFEACSGHSFEACSGHSFEACSGHS